MFPLNAVLDGIGLAGTVAGEQLSGHGIQIGFAGFALLYLARSDDLGRYVRIRRPTLRDVAWLVGIVIAVPILAEPVGNALTAIGVTYAEPHGEAIALYEHPAAVPALFVGLYLFAAPAEELVYRGLIHGRLRDGFSWRWRVLIAAALFGLMHLLVGFLTPSTGVTGALRWGLTACVPGLVFGIAYERTDNLAVTVVAHAISWTIPVGTLMGL
ncbi:MAG: CPBP family intramembrane glutamic endopeptidase [Halobacteriales archaeon]|nr:CPBP family intramembrane glutamic endopeptidase [Halobacteriales archaeon]